jgi:ABC-2 type transport system ATP-binding protein
VKGIEIRNLSKSYGEVVALKDINLKFGGDKIYGLLGRNGAGKTTLLNIISNRLFPDSGEVLVDGETAIENDSAQRKIYMMGESNFYPEGMTIRQAFRWSQRFYPSFDRNLALSLVEKFSLGLDKKMKSLSTGYNSIFKAIVALATKVPYTLLDEPVLGLDANHRDLLYKSLLESYQEHPRTIVISTHLIDEVANIIEDIVIIDQGEILRNQSSEEMLKQGYTVYGTAAAIDNYIADKEVIGFDNLGGLKTAYILGEVDNIIPPELEVTKLNLQKLFVVLTNRRALK